jgi:4-alpha-glucanotransferase
MTDQGGLARLAARFGILPTYHDLYKVERPTSPDTQKALLRANGVSVDSPALIQEALDALEARDAARRLPLELIVQSGRAVTLGIGEGWAWRIVRENPNEAEVEGRGIVTVPALPHGVHRLEMYPLENSRNAGQETITLIAAPAQVPLIGDVAGQERLWGVNTALYGLHAPRDSGIGDFEALASLSAGLAAQGAGFVGINPVHALGFSHDGGGSPYSPSHRGFLNTFHIALDRMPGLDHSAAAQQVLHDARAEVAALQASVTVPYQRHREVLRHRLEALFKAFRAEATPAARAEFSAFRAERGEPLLQFALFEALTAIHGDDWRKWPVDLKDKHPRAIAKAHHALSEQVAFHAWQQWVADRQLGAAQARAKSAGMALGLYLDLAVGARRSGAEGWCESNDIATGVSVGAPPDHLSPGGQNWDLAAFAPGKLKASGYGALRRVLAETARHCGVLRIDHVLGMNRSFWAPDDGSPGGYIKQPFDAILAVIKIEAARAGTAIIGEDLGLVPSGFRETMRSHGFYGYSVLQYEKDDTGQFRNPQDTSPQVLSCFGTHDTPTLNGFRQGHDIDWWGKLGWVTPEAIAPLRTTRAQDVNSLLALNGASGNTAQTLTTDYPTLSTQVHRALAASPAAMIAVQLDDVLGCVEAQNLPGTVDEHPNWQRRYGPDIDEIAQSPSLHEIASLMNAQGRASGSPHFQKDDTNV